MNAADYEKSTTVFAGEPAPSKGLVSDVVRLICSAFLFLAGWKVRGDWPKIDKMVLVVAPHTSNWDGLYMLAAAGYFRVKLRWMGKQSLTTGPFGGIVKWLGCVPIDRSARHDVVRAMSDAFAATDNMILAIPPEGTRSLAQEWKSGFWHIARMANVPIVVASLDYSSNTIRIEKQIIASDDYAKDLAEIHACYLDRLPKHPDLFQAGA